MIGSIFIIIKYPNTNLSKVKYANWNAFPIVFGNIIFTNIFHHSISGLIYAYRPQVKSHKTFFLSMLSGFLILLIHVGLAILALGGY